MIKPFRITVGSEPNREGLVGDIYYNDKIVAEVFQEADGARSRIRLHPGPDETKWEFDLEELEEALADLKSRLWDLRRFDA